MFIILHATMAQAQVTIGSGNPPQSYSILEVVSDSENTGGIRLPQLSTADKAKINADILSDPILSRGLFIFNTDSNEIEYWDGTQWVASLQVEPWMVSGTSDIATLNTQNIYQMGQVTIGSAAAPDPTAALNVVATNKGVLLPRVTLQSPTDVVTIPNPTVGLLVYNTGAGGLAVDGYLYWNGIEWVQFAESTTKPPQITALDCVNARIVPSRYEVGVQYEGVLIVPYSGGNGGYYGSGTPIPSAGVTGLTATLQPGNLAYGNGELVYTLSGIPSASSPELATFAIDFLGFQCQAIVGSNTISRGETIFWHGSMPANVGNGGELTSTVLASNYISDMPIVEDVFRLDAAFLLPSTNAESPITFIPRIYNASPNPVKFWWGGITSVEGRGRSNVILAPGGFQNLDNGMYMGLGQNMRTGVSTPGTALNYGSTSQETMTIDLFYNSKWFRIFFTGWVDNKDTTTQSQMTREIYITYERMY